MHENHTRLVGAVADAQRGGKAAWSKKGGEHLVLPGVIFIPTHFERHRAESRPTVASRGAMFLIPTALAAFYGSCSTWDEHDRKIPYGLLVLGIVALGLGIQFARSVQRVDRARDPNYVFRKGIYLLDDGALILQGEDADEDITKFFPRDRVVGTSYHQSGRTSHTHLVTNDEAGERGALAVHKHDVRSIIDKWLAATP